MLKTICGTPTYVAPAILETIDADSIAAFVGQAQAAFAALEASISALKASKDALTEELARSNTKRESLGVGHEDPRSRGYLQGSRVEDQG